MSEPRTEAGRTLREVLWVYTGSKAAQQAIVDHILAIEAEAAQAQGAAPLVCAYCDSPDGTKWHRPACIEVRATPQAKGPDVLARLIEAASPFGSSLQLYLEALDEESVARLRTVLNDAREYLASRPSDGRVCGYPGNDGSCCGRALGHVGAHNVPAGAAPLLLDHTFTTPDGRTHCRCGVAAIEAAASSAPQALDVERLSDFFHEEYWEQLNNPHLDREAAEGGDCEICWRSADRLIALLARLAPSEPTETGETDQP